MSKIADSTLQAVRSLGIERIVEPYVELRNKGRSHELWGCCPFHGEKTPSFKIDTERGFFKCFGCDAKGDGVTFIMRRLGFSYPDAVVFLAEKYGINVEYDGENSKNRKDIIALHEDLQKIMRKFFYEEVGKPAKEYILGRDFSEEDINEFGIGYIAPRVDYRDIFNRFSREVILQSGFFKESHVGFSARFFDRLTIPIKNITGSISAFAGRSLDGSDPKYLNSADSELFHKRFTLFNIDKAKDNMKKEGSAIVVEGYFDVLRLYKSGFKNVVAPMGTALTLEQINLIKRYSSEIVVIFDGDEAGEKAAFRSLPIFIGAGVFPKAVFLPKEDDPDSFILKKGAAGFDKVFAERDDLFTNVATRLAKSAAGDINKKLQRFQSVKKMLATAEDPHLRDYYSDALADIFKLKKENIEEDIENLRARKQSDKLIFKKEQHDIKYPCEADFLACISRLSVDTIDSLVVDLSPEMFNGEEFRDIFKKILEFYPNVADISELNNELGDVFIEIAMRDTIKGDVYRAAINNKRQIFKNYYEISKADLIEKQKLAATNEEKMLYIKKIDELTRMLAKLSASLGAY